MTPVKDSAGLDIVGWREWVELPDFGIPSIKAKVDTGARTSSLHAFELEEFKRGKRTWVRFEVHSEQRRREPAYLVEAPLVEHRRVRPSSGQTELRPVIRTTIALLRQTFEIELTLTRRDAMGFRMLLGREATRRRFLVDPGRSFLNGRRVKGTRRIKQRGTRAD